MVGPTARLVLWWLPQTTDGRGRINATVDPTLSGTLLPQTCGSCVSRRRHRVSGGSARTLASRSMSPWMSTEPAASITSPALSERFTTNGGACGAGAEAEDAHRARARRAPASARARIGEDARVADGYIIERVAAQ